MITMIICGILFILLILSLFAIVFISAISIATESMTDEEIIKYFETPERLKTCELGYINNL